MSFLPLIQGLYLLISIKLVFSTTLVLIFRAIWSPRSGYNDLPHVVVVGDGGEDGDGGRHLRLLLHLSQAHPVSARRSIPRVQAVHRKEGSSLHSVMRILISVILYHHITGLNTLLFSGVN